MLGSGHSPPLRRARLALAVAGLWLGCRDSDSPTAPVPGAVFVIRVCLGSEHNPGGELFRIATTDPTVIAEGEGLVGRGNQRIVIGDLARGDGGFNQPWSWHLTPETVRFVEGAIEACDGCATFVEEDLDYWVDVQGRFCPVSTEVLERVR